MLLVCDAGPTSSGEGHRHPKTNKDKHSPSPAADDEAPFDYDAFLGSPSPAEMFAQLDADVAALAAEKEEEDEKAGATFSCAHQRLLHATVVLC